MVILLSFPLLLFTQVDRSYYPFYPTNFYPAYMHGGFQPVGINTLTEENKTDIGVSLGTSVSTNFNKAYTVTTFAKPEIRHKLTKRFNIRGGLSIANSEYGNTLVYKEGGLRAYSGNITQGMLYVSGDYMISPKVVLSGTAYKEFSIDHSGSDDLLRPGYDGKGLMMNLRISPSENVFIDVGAEYYQGNNPFRQRYGPYHPSPFIW
jgi:hypothetical protein